MRFDKLIEIYGTKLVDDGMSGYIEEEGLIISPYANVGPLSTKYATEVFGRASKTALNVVIMESIDKKQCKKVKYHNEFYEILDIKPVKNKTRLILEVMDND